MVTFFQLRAIKMKSGLPHLEGLQESGSQKMRVNSILFPISTILGKKTASVIILFMLYTLMIKTGFGSPPMEVA